MNTCVAFLRIPSLFLSFKTNLGESTETLVTWLSSVPEVMEDGLDDLNMPIVSQTFIIPLKVVFCL